MPLLGAGLDRQLTDDTAAVSNACANTDCTANGSASATYSGCYSAT